MKVVLISTYELGRQPFGLASPAAWLKQAGAQVTCFDLVVQHLDDAAIRSAHLIAFYLPMHTATRLATPLIRQVKQTNPSAHLCGYGLYAPMNEKFLRSLGVDTIIGGEFEEVLVALYERLADGKAAWAEPIPSISLAKLKFLVPDRSGLPDLSHYARLDWGDGEPRVTGYTEASRGCKHLCRHCPIVPVYGGQFRIVQRDVVLADIRNQVEAGARHITFGDPDFFNGPGHVIPIVQAMHAEFPDVTYDVTIKIEHLLKHSPELPILRDTGCLFITSAVEAVDNRILEILDKRHTREDFIQVAALFREIGLTLNPTFVSFNPWISMEGYRDLLALIAELDLIDNVAPIQLAIRLLIPAGSKLLELPPVREWVGEFDEERLCYPWSHPDPRMDQLHEDVLQIVKEGQAGGATRRALFKKIWALAYAAFETEAQQLVGTGFPLAAKPIPRLSEPWYC